MAYHINAFTRRILSLAKWSRALALTLMLDNTEKDRSLVFLMRSVLAFVSL